MSMLRLSRRFLLKICLLSLSGNAFTQVVFTDNFGASNMANFSSYTGPGGAYTVSAGIGNTVDLRTASPSPDGGAYVFAGFAPSILNLSGSNSITSPAINVGALSSIVVSFYFKPIISGVYLGVRQFSVEINTGSGFGELIASTTMATYADGDWYYVVSPVVAVTPGQNIQLRFNSSFNALSALAEANYSIDLLRVGTLDALPITHKQFTASTVNGKVKLRWVAMTTQPNAFFEVERSQSINGNFQKLTSIQAGCICEQSYQFIDESPGQPENYYRVKMIDENKKITYTNALKVKLSGDGLTLDNVFPTLAKQQLNLVIGSSKQQQVTVEILDGNGRRVMVKELPVYTGSKTYPLDIDRIQKGNYFVMVRAQGFDETRQFVKQ